MKRRIYIKTTATGLGTIGLLPQAARGQTQEIAAGEKITGTIDSSDDRDEFGLPVGQGDIVKIQFNKDLRALTKLNAYGAGGDIELGGYNSEGKEQLTGRTTIEETGTLNINVDTDDTETDGQGYTFTPTIDPQADAWPEEDPAEITSDETVSGTIHTSDDRDEFELPVNQGDVIEVVFNKGPRALTKLNAYGAGGDIELGGYNSEGKEQLSGRTTIKETGTFNINVDTDDAETDGQEYTFTPTIDPQADAWPEEDPAEITSDETVSGTIHTSDDRDEFELLVNQGDVIDVTFGKGSRMLTRLNAYGAGGDIELGGYNSEGKGQLSGRTTIKETGTFNINVNTDDEETDGQEYTFTPVVAPQADTWPEEDPAEISSGKTISGTIHTSDDRDEFELLVNQGDVIDMTFEKESRSLTAVNAYGSGGDIELGGFNSEGQEQLTGQTTIEETGIFNINIQTDDDETNGQDYRFVINGELKDDNQGDGGVEVVKGQPATDTTGDGKLNDVNGDGEFDIFDVQALYNNLDSDAVQNNPELFDFSGSGGDPSIFDVQALYSQV